jgi:N-methylhydantoinase B
VNPHFPAAVASRAQALTVLADLMFETLAMALPDQVPAPGEGGMTVFVFSGQSKGGKAPGVLTDIWAGGWGARPNRDGVEGVVQLSANGFRTSSGELMELESPVALDGFGFVPDTGGPGRFRGTSSLFRRFRFREDGRVSLRTTRATSVAPGREGGGEGGPFSLSLIRDGVVTELPRRSQVHLDVQAGDVIEHIVSGGGGFGDPFTRDPERVLDDVLDGKVSIDRADSAYGVVIDAATQVVDHSRTEARRTRTES